MSEAAIRSPADASGVVRVVGGALYDAQGRVLIAERPAGKHMAGRWEFPGGKLEPGESHLQALRRELREELGIEIASAHEALTLRHDYPDRRVEVCLWVVEHYRGEPRGLDGQKLKWVTPAQLSQEDVLEADQPFIELLQRRAAKPALNHR